MTLSQNWHMLLLFEITLLSQRMIIYSKVYSQDVEALQDLYNVTNGPNWFFFKWDPQTLKDGDVCDLHRVTCNSERTRVTEISLGLNGLNGILPPSIGQLSALQKLDLSGNELFGSIPPTISGLQSLTELKVNVNKLSGGIPDTIGQLNKLKTLNLGTNILSGTIPASIGNLTELTDLEIEYSRISGTIPASIGNLHKIRAMLLQNNNLEGTIPPSLGNKSHMTALTLSHNALSGRIPDSLGLLPKIKDFLLNDNDLYSDNFGEILSNLLGTKNRLSNYESIQIHNNPKLGGDLSALENMGNVTLYSFTAFNCSLYGYIPKSIQFQNVGEFYIWDNRLSCELPMNLLSLDRSSKMASFSPFDVLQSNLFWIKSIATKPIWLSSYDSFSSASLLYYTETDEIVSYIVAAFTALCILIFMIKKIIIKDKCCTTSNYSNKGRLLEVNPHYDALFVFWGNLEYIQKALNDMKLVLITIVLLGFYYWNSTYFKCSPILSQLSLGYYMPSNNYCDWILVVILFPLIYICLWCTILKAQTEQLTQEKQFEAADSINIIGYDHNEARSKCTIVAKIWWCLFYLCLFLGATAFVVLSIIFESLPEHNAFGLNSKNMKVLQYSIAIILTINTAIIIPNFIDCSFTLIKLCCKSWSELNYLVKYRPFIILLLRTTSTIIVPTITSMYLLNDCGKYWTYFWVECYPSNQSQFDSNIGPQYVYLTADSVCSPKSFSVITWNKCIRSFTTKWSFVIIQKLFYMILMPIVMILCKRFQHKIYSKFEQFKKYNVNQKNICFDMEYTMILTKYESMIIFGVISPFVIPLTICSVNSNYFIYRKMVEKDKWRVKPWDNNILFPIYFLWMAVFISQFFVSCFVFLCIENFKAGLVLIGILVVIDAVFIMYYMRYKRKTTSLIDAPPAIVNEEKEEVAVKSTSNKPTIN